ncbi:hypothetical protein M432DRAFT_635553 [Thermoascus aurantiacus ATCC 26904]
MMLKMHVNFVVFVASWVLAALALGANLPREFEAIEAHGFEIDDHVDNLNVYGANDASFFAKLGKLFPRGDVVTVTVTECGPHTTPSPIPETSSQPGPVPSTVTVTPIVSPTEYVPVPSVTTQTETQGAAPTTTVSIVSPVPSPPAETPETSVTSGIEEHPSSTAEVGVSATAVSPPASTAAGATSSAPVPSHTTVVSNDAPHNEGTTAAMLAMAVGLVALVMM